MANLRLEQPMSWLETRLAETGEVYEGQFGSFTINRHDRSEVLIYRTSLLIAATSMTIAASLALWPSEVGGRGLWITGLYGVFCLALGMSLWTIHIYLKSLHRVLQSFWVIGCLASIGIALTYAQPLAVTVYQQPQTIWGVGFGFAALTGIFFKEAFCFRRLETLVLTLLVPGLLLGHLWQFLPVGVAQTLVALGVVLFLVFALRKMFQQIPADIGDKSVFAYLQQQR